MVLCWRRHGRAGGCRIPFEITDESLLYIKLVLPVIREDNAGCCFWWLIKQSKALYIENRILIKNLKVSKFVKQTRDKQDIRGKNRKILERKNKQNQPNDVTLYIESWESSVRVKTVTMWSKTVTRRHKVCFVFHLLRKCSANDLKILTCASTRRIINHCQTAFKAIWSS